MTYPFVNYNSAFVTISFIVRLVDGPTIYEGRVEVQYNGIWGRVCHYGWDMSDAQVVCSELGFGKALAATRDAYYARGIRQFWLYNVNCDGNEWTIGNCSNGGWRYDFCYWYDASIKCSSGNSNFILKICLLYITMLAKYLLL